METPGGVSSPPLGEQEEEGLWLMNRPSRSIAIPSIAASRLLISGFGILTGLTVRENAGAVAVWDILDGVDSGGEELFPVGLAAGAVTLMNMGKDGPMFRRGLFLYRTSGTIIGAVWVKL